MRGVQVLSLQNKPKILAQPYGVYFAVSLSIARSEFEMDLLGHPLLRSLWHYVNTQLISPDQQISRNPAFLQVLTHVFDNQHLDFTYPLNFYRGSKDALSFSQCSPENTSKTQRCHIMVTCYLSHYQGAYNHTVKLNGSTLNSSIAFQIRAAE